jgi:hypothetical protein
MLVREVSYDGSEDGVTGYDTGTSNTMPADNAIVGDSGGPLVLFERFVCCSVVIYLLADVPRASLVRNRMAMKSAVPNSGEEEMMDL